MKTKYYILLLSIFLCSTNLSKTRTELTGNHNYLGKDNKWHYVNTYKDKELKKEFTIEWVNREGPYLYNKSMLPNFDLNSKGNSNPKPNDFVYIKYPCELDFTFNARRYGILEFKVNENVKIEISNLSDNELVYENSNIQGQANNQQLNIPYLCLSVKPYKIVVYKDNIPKYMEMFYFNGVSHNSIEDVASFGFDA
jgi:hypothetical protein